jgi:hypothetical protein
LPRSILLLVGGLYPQKLQNRLSRRAAKQNNPPPENSFALH